MTEIMFLVASILTLMVSQPDMPVIDDEVRLAPPPVIEQISAQEIEVSSNGVELIALITLAEAEGECELGQRLVIDTVLNRLDSDRFPDTIHEVLYQKNQYESMTNGRVNRVVVSDEMRQLVKEELEHRTNSDVLFFRTNHYHKFGSPMFQVGNHYFSTL